MTDDANGDRPKKWRRANAARRADDRFAKGNPGGPGRLRKIARGPVRALDQCLSQADDRRYVLSVTGAAAARVLEAHIADLQLKDHAERLARLKEEAKRCRDSFRESGKVRQNRFLTVFAPFSSVFRRRSAGEKPGFAALLPFLRRRAPLENGENRENGHP